MLIFADKLYNSTHKGRFIIMKYITVEEFANKVGLSARSVRNYCAQGRIAGATLSGKTWMIPESSGKPARINSNEIDIEASKYGEDLINFINNSPVSFVAIKNIADLLLSNGYKEINEKEDYKYKRGDKVFIVRNDTTLIALNIGSNPVLENGYHVIAAHSDSPCFKIKPVSEGKTDIYHKVNIAPYGGLVAPSFLDRPLGAAGRIIYEKNGELIHQVIDFKDLTVFIPNICIHFNREVNNGYAYDMAIDMQAFISSDGASFLEAIAKRLKVRTEDISNYDLYLYNKQSGMIWGENSEFISSPRLDDLECVYTSTRAFVESNNEDAINVLYITDNEEVGSLSRQGADSDFLKSIFVNLCNDLSLNYYRVIANSFLISADNAHAVHPNKPGLTDDDNKVYMNKGIAIKFNASNSYTSDGVSSSVFQKICKNASVPYQFFSNKSNMRGGSTLGNILLSQVSLPSVDIGLAQLAMHSSYETAGTIDIKYAIKAFKEFYSSNIFLDNGKIEIK